MKLPKKIRSALTGLSLLVASAIPNTAKADFYDGCRGPDTAQIHYTATASEKGLEHSLAGKYFGDNLFGIGSAGTNGGKFTGGFAGVGYLFEYFGRMKALPVLGYSISGDGQQGTSVGVAQATIFLDQEGIFLLDPRYTMTIPTHGLEDHTPGHHFGLTASAGNARIRFGPDVSYSIGTNPAIALLLRYDFDPEHHSSWVEFRLNSDASAQFQFRGNF